MAFPGMMNMGGGNASQDPQQMQEQQMIRLMQNTMESCPGKTVIAGGMGFALGGVFGLFMSSMRYDTPMSTASSMNPALTSLPIRQQLAAGFKDMGKASYSSARNFGYIGAVFAGTECAIEGFRAKNDLYNGVAAGCLTGGFLAKGGGPQAMAIGCAGFAAFSAAIDAYMRMPSDDVAADPII
ncbi:Mitochondrial import inner membrane translocase subunit tim22 [Cryoendolithus antarcticus]|uniref:Mitochondrial import inner membrane translocase subunit TIM22 n=1 Tax=Cryoendolithus antarcticus TaxID=1507870 RepID=A0A1V8TVN4_9PEZI|nr:Mitochondrial import inner membrane translocase subunit tim22 [Cryoendolithus antarcticus]